MSNPLPPYTYVPGKTPHPISDPRGHMYAREHVMCEAEGGGKGLVPHELERLDGVQRGLQLYAAGFYWEAHEAWEGVWLQLGRTAPAALFVKGLIKLAAAGVKALEGNRSGVERHARRAADLLCESQIAGHHWLKVARQLSIQPPVADLDPHHPEPIPGFTPVTD